MAPDSEVSDDSAHATLVDGTNRLEQTLENQLERLADLDEKAANVTRLVGILLALVFTLLTLVLNEGPGAHGAVSLPAQLSVLLGLAALLTSLGFAIGTYLSSRYRVGLHRDVATYLRTSEGAIPLEDHLRLVIGSYETMISENRLVLRSNAYRFRTALGSLLSGILFLSTTGLLYFGRMVGRPAWLLFVVTGGLTVSICVIIAKEMFMPIPSHRDDDGRQPTQRYRSR